MMEIDRMSYIFGSFARRRQSQDVGIAKRRSIESSKLINHDRSKSTPHNTPKKSVQLLTPRAKSVYNAIFDESKFKCPMCRRQFIEPKVLPCLHTFCLRCLQELESSDYSSCQDNESNGSANTLGSRNGSGSEASGYIIDRTNSCGPTSNGKRICCPTCGARAEVPIGGVILYPPNYLLQHRIVLATLNAQTTHLLCDLCTTEISAVSRCMDCAINFCHNCEEIHLRQKFSADHEVLALEEARKKGITKIRRQIMCIKHPESELDIYCSTCCQVICQECISTHKGHTFEHVSRALKANLQSLRLAADKAKAIAEQSALAANRLNVTSKHIEAQCNKVQAEVEKFIENYIKAIEAHKKNLTDQIVQTKNEKLEEINAYKLNLHQKVKDARDVGYFLDELLSEGTDIEIMSFYKSVLSKIEKCGHSSKMQDLSLSESSLQFLPDEQVPGGVYPLYGVVTCQKIGPQYCTLNCKGLQNLRVGRKCEVILETRDRNNIKLERGGEEIFAEIRFRDAGVSRSLNVEIEDQRDGTYLISFVPDVAGKMILNINVRGQPIRENPFPFIVKTLKPHHGTFHCCTFCSSGGSKEAQCGCGGKMPGGYKGCGHGHIGHPGRRHWSCCGNVLEHSECGKTNSSQYQFTL